MASIYEAEIRRKPKASVIEDQATSRVFGTLDALKSEVLVPLLRQMVEEDIPELSEQLDKLPSEHHERIQLKLWKHCGEGTPDVYIKVPKVPRPLLIEVKKETQIDVEEIIRQYKGAWEEYKHHPYYFVLTRGKEKGKDQNKIKKAQERLRKQIPDATIHCLTWAQVYKWLDGIRKTSLEGLSKRLLDDLLSLLEVERMKDVTGLKEEWFSDDMVEGLNKLLDLYNEIYLIISELNTKAREVNIEPMFPMPNQTRSRPISNIMSPDGWAFTSLDFTYRDENWEAIEKPNDNKYLFVNFYLLNESGVSVGFYMANMSDEQRKELEDNEPEGFQFYPEDSQVEYDFEIDELCNREMVDKLFNKLKETRDFVNKVQSMRRDLGLH